MAIEFISDALPPGMKCLGLQAPGPLQASIWRVVSSAWLRFRTQGTLHGFTSEKWWNLTSEIGISSANSANMMIFRHIKMGFQHQKWGIWPANMVIWPKMGLSQHGEIEPPLAALKTNIFHLETATISIGRSSSKCVEVWKLASHTKWESNLK